MTQYSYLQKFIIVQNLGHKIYFKQSNHYKMGEEKRSRELCNCSLFFGFLLFRFLLIFRLHLFSTNFSLFSFFLSPPALAILSLILSFFPFSSTYLFHNCFKICFNWFYFHFLYYIKYSPFYLPQFLSHPYLFRQNYLLYLLFSDHYIY